MNPIDCHIGMYGYQCRYIMPDGQKMIWMWVFAFLFVIFTSGLYLCLQYLPGWLKNKQSFFTLSEAEYKPFGEQGLELKDGLGRRARFWMRVMGPVTEMLSERPYTSLTGKGVATFTDICLELARECQEQIVHTFATHKRDFTFPKLDETLTRMLSERLYASGLRRTVPVSVIVRGQLLKS